MRKVHYCVVFTVNMININLTSKKRISAVRSTEYLSEFTSTLLYHSASVFCVYIYYSSRLEDIKDKNWLHWGQKTLLVPLCNHSKLTICLGFASYLQPSLAWQWKELLMLVLSEVLHHGGGRGLFPGVATPDVSCHKEPARASEAPYVFFVLCLFFMS